MWVVILIEYIFYWMTFIPGWSILLYLRVIPFFENEHTFYETTKRKHELKDILDSHHIFLSETLLDSLSNPKFKRQAFQKYEVLIEAKITIISFLSPLYPQTLRSWCWAPFCLLTKGEIPLLHTTIGYIFYDIAFSQYGNHMYHLFSEYITRQGGTLILLLDSIEVEHLATPSILLTTEEKLIGAIPDVNLYIAIPHVVQEIDSLSCIAMLANTIIIPEGGYEAREKLGVLVEAAIEVNHEVFVIPGNIYRPSCYFSNYLIRQGANILLNRHDLDPYFQKNTPVDNF